MIKLFKITLVFIFALSANNIIASNNGGEHPGENTDSSVNMNSNIVIFKMIMNQQYTGNTASGTLKKAGKVARTSNSLTSFKTDSIIFPKRPL